ncbi:MAG: inositol monophosphatase family protein [Cyclobacteriaceae bacterium]
MKIEDIVKETEQIVKSCGEFIREESHKFSHEDVELKGKADLVSYVDKQSEKRLVKELNKLLPEAGFITEEGTIDQQVKEYTWIVDPLDGTTNFVHGIPSYAVSVGLRKGDEIIMGFVYEINRSECFYAWQDGGAYLDGNAIRVSPVMDIEEGLFSTGFPANDFPKVDEYLTILKELLSQSRGLRRMGSAASDLAYVACGRLQGFFEYNLKPWDVAGACVIIKEAGGYVSDFKGGNNYVFGGEIIAACGAHPQLVNLINQHWHA